MDVLHRPSCAGAKDQSATMTLRNRVNTALLATALIIGGCGNRAESQPAPIAPPQLPTSLPTSSESGWDYSTSKDEMRKTEIHMAKLSSSNVIELEFPYAGGSNLSIVIIKRSGEKSKAMLMLSNGQLSCVSQDGCRIEVKFDDQQVGGIHVSPAGNGFTDTLFVDKDWDTAFVRKLKTTNDLIIEVPVYRGGLRQFKFRTAGLKWD